MVNQPKKWTSEKVKAKIQLAFEELVKKDHFLLTHDVNERSLTHCLAIYIKKQFRNYDVDCEYNRDGVGRDSKRISRIKDLDSFRENVSTADEKGVTVYPDIIIHFRGKAKGLVIIEAKKSNRGPNDDEEKLRLYKEELGYPYAFFIKFPAGTSLKDLVYDDTIKEIK